jgi:hypothetical protein
MSCLMLDPEFKSFYLIYFLLAMNNVWTLLKNIVDDHYIPCFDILLLSTSNGKFWSWMCKSNNRCRFQFTCLKKNSKHKWIHQKNLSLIFYWFSDITNRSQRNQVSFPTVKKTWSQVSYYWFLGPQNPKDFKITIEVEKIFFFNGHIYKLKEMLFTIKINSLK